MNDERLRQRIAYLVEHGVVDDPLDEIKHRVRTLTYLVWSALTLNVMQLAARLLM